MSPSFSSRAIRLLFRLMQTKKSYQTDQPPYLRMRRWNYAPSSSGSFTFDPAHQAWFYRPRTAQNSKRVIIWFHGGAYSLGPFRPHFSQLKKICDRTQSIGILLNYPKAPEFNHQDVFQFLDRAFADFEVQFKGNELFWVGDSAGGGLAIAYALHRQSIGKLGPKSVFTISPAVDMSLSQKEIADYDRIDPFLSERGIRAFGEWYAGQAGVKDPKVSPLFAPVMKFNFKLHLHSGTHDVLHPSIEAFYHRFKDSNPGLSLEVYPEMMHAWALMPIPEAKRTFQLMIKAILQ